MLNAQILMSCKRKWCAPVYLVRLRREVENRILDGDCKLRFEVEAIVFIVCGWKISTRQATRTSANNGDSLEGER
jgi:hypothetical protein